MSKFKTALLIDGGYLRHCTKRAKIRYEPKFIEAFSRACFEDDEYRYRIFYYDAPRFEGEQRLPISGKQKSYDGNDKWFDDIAALERFAVRLGTLGFRGWKLKRTPAQIERLQKLSDADYREDFQQKGVDMRIGLDIAVLSERRSVDRILLVSADTDMVPAMKHARKAGIEIGIVLPPVRPAKLHDNLKAHADFVRILERNP